MTYDCSHTTQSVTNLLTCRPGHWMSWSIASAPLMVQSLNEELHLQTATSCCCLLQGHIKKKRDPWRYLQICHIYACVPQRVYAKQSGTSQRSNLIHHESLTTPRNGATWYLACHHLWYRQADSTTDRLWQTNPYPSPPYSTSPCHPSWTAAPTIHNIK